MTSSSGVTNLVPRVLSLPRGGRVTGQQSLQAVFSSSGQKQANFRWKGKLCDEKLDKGCLELCCDVSSKEIFVLNLTNRRQFSMVYTLLLKTGSLYNAIPGI